MFEFHERGVAPLSKSMISVQPDPSTRAGVASGVEQGGSGGLRGAQPPSHFLCDFGEALAPLVLPDNL